MQSFKAFLKSVLPEAAIRKIRRMRSERHYRRYAKLTPAGIFAHIYREGLWGGGAGDLRSGTGSLPEQSRAYEDVVVALAGGRGVRSILDIGCGDFQVSRRILDRLGPEIDYVGLDLVPELIARNAQRHGTERVRFHLAHADQPYPPADLVLIRQVLQHNDNRTVADVLARARQAGGVLLVAEHVPLSPKRANIDIRTGHETRLELGSGVFIDLPPFGLPVAQSTMIPMEPGTALRVTVTPGLRPAGDARPAVEALPQALR
jgi:SAM-dependent methyltransferase